MIIWLNLMFLWQELQKIVKDLFLLINETNADKASQEVLVKTGLKVYSCSHFQFSIVCSDKTILFICSVQRDGREPRRSGVSKRVHWGVHGPEEVQHNAHFENHRRLHRRGHLEQPPAAATVVRRTPDLVMALLSLKLRSLGWASPQKWTLASRIRIRNRFQLFSKSCRFMKEHYSSWPKPNWPVPTWWIQLF